MTECKESIRLVDPEPAFFLAEDCAVFYVVSTKQTALMPRYCYDVFTLIQQLSPTDFSFELDAASVARQLAIQEEQVKDAITLMVNVGMIEYCHATE